MVKLESKRFISANYFAFAKDHGTSSSFGTSKKEFSKLKNAPKNSQISTILANTPEIDPTFNQLLSNLHEKLTVSLIPQLLLHLECGNNLALYGYGSKTSFLNSFCKYSSEKGWNVFRMKAFNKEDSLLSLFKMIISTTRNVSSLPTKVEDIIDLVMECCSTPTLIVIEMADSLHFRNPNNFSILSQLTSKSKSIRLTMTFEHVHSHLLTSEDEWKGMRLVWYNITTMLPYTEELLSLLSVRKDFVDVGEAWKGAKFVLKSLTKTGRNVFKVLADYQTSHTRIQSKSHPKSTVMDEEEADSADEEEEDYIIKGLGITEWYQKCQEQFIVSNEVAFRTQLTEFIDHGLVKSVDGGLGQNGTEFYIPFSASQIQNILQETCHES